MQRWSDSTKSTSRRGFLALCSAVALGTVFTMRPGWARGLVFPKPDLHRGCHGPGHASGPPYDHPDPRPGIDGSGVLSAEDLSDAPHAIPTYDKVRQIPEVADGILCHCGCDHGERYPSLLVCYEKGGMAMWCEVCQGEGNLAYRLHTSGKSLDQIRVAIDAKFG